MRICVLTTSYPRGAADDAGIFVKRLVQAYGRLGAAGVVAVPYDRAEAEREDHDGFRVERFRYGLFRRGSLAFGAGIMPNLREHPARLFQAPLLLLGFLRAARRARRECDVVHAHWLFAGLAAWLAFLSAGKPYFITVLGEDMRLLESRLCRLFFRSTVKNAAGIISVNQGFLEELKRIYSVSPERLVHIPAGVDFVEIEPAKLERFAAARGLEPDGKYLIFVGSLIPRKRVEAPIEFIARPALREWRLVLCGRTDNQAYFDKLKTLAEELGCRERVLFCGRTAPDEIPYYLKICRRYITASEYEGRPNAVLEAFSAGCLVFASDIPMHREIISRGEQGYLFDPRDLAGLERDFLSAVSDPQKSEAVARRAQAAVKELTWEESAERHLELFGKALAAAY